MDDETYIKLDFNQIFEPKYYFAKNLRDLTEKFQCIGFDKYGKQVLVWQGICSCRLKTRAFVISATMTSKLCFEEHL